jgi:adenylate cyclase
MSVRERSVGAPGMEARGFREATLLYADIANLDELAECAGPREARALAAEMGRAFERSAERHGLSGVAVRGVAFAAVAGVPQHRGDHAPAAAEAALEVAASASRLVTAGGISLALRVGLHSGPVVAALAAGQRGVHEVWGESAKVAMRMESQCVAGHILVSGSTACRLATRYRLEARGQHARRAQGQDTFFLTGKRAA